MLLYVAAILWMSEDHQKSGARVGQHEVMLTALRKQSMEFLHDTGISVSELQEVFLTLKDVTVRVL